MDGGQARPPQRSPLLKPDWSYVEKPALEAFGRAEWELLRDQRAAYRAEQQVEHVLRMLRAQDADPSFGYQVNNYRHCLQAATAALNDGRDEDYVVVALLHDIGFTACPTTHGAFAAALLGPYISDGARWMLEHHQIFQMHHCHDHPEDHIDPGARERWRGHPMFDATAEFVARYDQSTIVAGRPEAPLGIFAPMLARVLARGPRPIPPRED